MKPTPGAIVRLKMSIGRTSAVMSLTALVLVLSACSKSTSGGSSGLSGVSPSSALGVPSSSTGAGAPTATSTGTKTAKPPPVAAGPKVDTFAVARMPACAIVPDSAAPFSAAPVDIIVKWSVSGGATKVALSLDDKNWFKNNGNTGSIGSDYPLTGTTELPFECDPKDPKDQPNTTHTFTLNTIGGGPTVAKTLTVTVQTQP